MTYTIDPKDCLPVTSVLARVPIGGATDFGIWTDRLSEATRMPDNWTLPRKRNYR